MYNPLGKYQFFLSQNTNKGVCVCVYFFFHFTQSPILINSSDAD